VSDLIGDICSRIVSTLGAAVTGITLAVDPPPPKLDTANLPALWAFTGPAVNDDEVLGEGMILTSRSIRVQVAVIPLGRGDPATRESLCRPLLEAVREKYYTTSSLRSLAWIQDVRVMGDSGIVVLPEYGSQYIGFEVRLEVLH
jgi:hypothetical protein